MEYFKHIHLPRRCLPPNVFYSMPRSARKYFIKYDIRHRIYTERIPVARDLYNMRVKRRRKGNRRNSAAAPICLRLHRHSSRSASSNDVFALPFAHSPNNQTYPLPPQVFNAVRLLSLLLPSHLCCRDSSLLLESTGSDIHWSRGC